MRQIFLLTPFTPWLLLLASCSSPPKLPTADESRKRPANTSMAIELQTCSSELQNTRLRALDAERMAERAAIEQQRMAVLKELVAKLEPPQQAFAMATGQAFLRPNAIATVHFEYGSTRVDIPPAAAGPLISEAKAAPLVLLRGRTDGTGETRAEAHIARSRAAAVAAYLIEAGVPPNRIRATYQPTGDHAAENHSPQGRAQNRRVEIEIYRTVPVPLNNTEATSPSPR